jgi:hypothetical protein
MCDPFCPQSSDGAVAALRARTTFLLQLSSSRWRCCLRSPCHPAPWVGLNTSVTIAGATLRIIGSATVMEYMSKITSLTLADAASGTGIFKSNIFSAIKSCRLSGALSEYGKPRIEAAELHRELAETRARASLAEQRVADLTAMLDDVSEQRDRWQAQANQLSSVLTDQQRKAPRWWPWRRSTRDGARLQITHVRDNPSDLKSD